MRTSFLHLAHIFLCLLLLLGVAPAAGAPAGQLRGAPPLPGGRLGEGLTVHTGAGLSATDLGESDEVAATPGNGELREKRRSRRTGSSTGSPTNSPTKAPTNPTKAPTDASSTQAPEDFRCGKAKDEVQKAKDEAQKAKDEAQKAKDEAQKAKDEAQKAKDEAQKAKDEATRLQKQLDHRGGAPEKAVSGQALKNCSNTSEWGTQEAVSGHVSGKVLKNCSNTSEWGWTKPGTRQWVNGSWSRAIATGFHGNSVRTEEYQVRHPSCLPECKRRWLAFWLPCTRLFLSPISLDFDSCLRC